MTVQGVNESNNSSWMLPVGGLAVGAGAGAWKAPAKYSSFDDLVEAATKDDSFTMPKVADGADDDAKKAFKTVTDAVENRKTQETELAKLFTGDTKKVDVKNVLKITGQENVTAETIATANRNKALAKMFAEQAKEGETLKITDDMRKLFDTKNGETVVAGTEDNIKQALKAMGADLYEVTVTKDMLEKVAAEGKKATEEIANTKAAAELIASAEDGKVTKEAAETFIKTGSDAAKTAFDNVKGMFGKNMWKGAGIGAVVGLAAGWVISKFMGGSKDKA